MILCRLRAPSSRPCTSRSSGRPSTALVWLAGWGSLPGPIPPGVTPAKTVHLTELRAALNQAYQAAGWTPPAYTDPTIVAEQTVIQAIHLNELRTAVRALQ